MSGIIKPPFGTQLKLDHSLSKGLVGSWLLNEGSGLYANDSSGQGNVGTLSGFNDPPIATSGWNAGPHGGALVFDTNDDYMSFPDQATNFGTGDYTVELWISGFGAVSRHFCPSNQVTNMSAPMINVRPTQVIIQRHYSGSYLWTSTIDPLVINQCVVTRKGGVVQLFFNGIERALSISGSNYSQSGYDFIGGANLGRFWYLTQWYYGGGLISSLRIWKGRALSAEESAYLYAFPYCMYEEAWHSPWTLSTIAAAAARYKILTDKNALVGTKVYYVADASEGGVTRKLTFIDGILAAEI